MLLGRDQEREQIGTLVAGARRGEGGALLIAGEPGIGKTSLLEEAIARAGDLGVIRTAGIEAEANLPYASLGEAVAPLLDLLPRLAEPRADAIRAALALGTPAGPPADRFATCAAFLSLLTFAAQREPLLVVVDDAQWLDTPSAECLAYAARRLTGTPVAMLVSARPGREGPCSDLVRSSAWTCRSSATRTLGRCSGPRRPRPPRRSSTAWSSWRRVTRWPCASCRPGSANASGSGLEPVDHVPVGGGALLEAFEARLAALAPDDRAAVVVASAAVDREPGPVVSACRDLGIPTSALERAEDAGVLSVSEQRLSFTHPLVKAVAYERTSPAERRRAHKALAAHCDDDARAWHLAAATVGPDDDVADLLEAAARRASVRGAHSVAADALQRAAGFSEQDEARADRIYGAALAAALGGDYHRCAGLLEPLTEIDDALQRARIRHTIALVTMTGGIRSITDAHLRLGEEAERVLAIDPATSAAMHADAALLAGVGGQVSAGLPAARRAVAVLPEDAPPMIRCRVHALFGIGRALTGNARDARDSLDEAGRLLAESGSLSPATQSAVLGLHARVCTGQEETLRSEIARLVEMAEQADTFGLFPYLLGVSADVAYRVGDWAAAAGASTSVAHAEEYGQRGILPFCLVISARLRAAVGETEQARAELEHAAALAQELGAGMVDYWVAATLGFLELGLGRADQAIVELERAEAHAARSGLEDPTFVPWAPDLVEAYLRAGRPGDAKRASASLGRRAARADVPLAHALAARCRGLIAEDGFDQDFELALAQHAHSVVPFETARTLLAYGSRLHRVRRRVEARKRLRAAREVFDDLGARPWIARTDAELRAAGAIRRDPNADPDQLSAQEMNVALAVSEGATNREVAASMFLSPKTIDFHLGRIYRKLGIHSRTELAALAARGELEAPTRRPTRTGPA